MILVCRTDKRSADAEVILRDLGFHDVTVLRGGMERWNTIGLPIEGQNNSSKWSPKQVWS
jgi:rhodanese-related sulfurtransferase